LIFITVAASNSIALALFLQEKTSPSRHCEPYFGEAVSGVTEIASPAKERQVRHDLAYGHHGLLFVQAGTGNDNLSFLRGVLCRSNLYIA
jgi:hypothetical protein